VRRSKDADLKRHVAAYLCLVTVLWCASGASCPTMRQGLTPQAPTLFAGPPTLQETIAAVNASSGQIRQLQSDSASLSIQGMPTLRASVAAGLPRNFRLRANFMGVGEVLDLGSNDQLFWAMVDAPQFASGMPKAVYYARHDQYRHSAARQMLPIRPQWLVEAFGLVQLDPAGFHEGPYQHGPGQLQIRSRIASPDGDLTKVLVLHDRFGWIQEQHWYDPRGQLIASVFASQHRYEPTIGVSLPHVIDVRMPPPTLSLRISVETYAVNQVYSDPAQLWAMPAFDGYPQIDLAAAAPPSLPPSVAPPAYSAPASPPNGFPQTGYRLNYRGYTARRPGFPLRDVNLQ